MPYSPTLSAENSTLGQLWITLQNYMENASSHEKPMLMVELIYIALYISQTSFEAEEQMFSMYTASTQMFHLRTLHHKRASTMRARMATLWQGGLEDQMLARSLELEITGMISLLQKVERNFFNYCTRMLQDSYAVALPNLKSTLIGNIGQIEFHTNTQRATSWYKTLFLSSAHGYKGYLTGLAEVSLARQGGRPPRN